MDQLDLFSAFGLKPATEKKEAKKEKKQEKKKEKKQEVKKDTFTLPFEVKTPWENILIKEEDLHIAEPKEEDILKHISGGLSAKYMSLDKDGTLYYKGNAAKKGTYKKGEDTKLFIGSTQIDISALEEGEVSEKELTEAISVAFPFVKESADLIAFGQDGDLIIAIPNGTPMTEIDVPEENVTIHLLNGEVETLGKKEYTDLLDEQHADAEEDELSTLLKPSAIDLNGLKGEFLKTGKDEYLLTYPVKAAGSATTGNSAASKKYSVENVTFSLSWTSYDVTPADFGGQTEVEEKDIVAFLVKQGHREMKFTGVTIQEIKKLNMLFITPKGSRKGALLESVYSFPEGVEISCVNHPAFAMATGPNIKEFLWKLQKVPYKILLEGLRISRIAYTLYKCEVLMELYYTDGNYIWYIPDQTVAGASVEAVNDVCLALPYETSGILKVGQFHSHGSFNAFFSSTDDKDELSPGIYGVYGRMDQEDYPDFVMRAVSGHGRMYLEISDVFAPYEDIPYEDDQYEPEIRLKVSVNQKERKGYRHITISGTDGLILPYQTARIYSHHKLFHVYTAQPKDGRWTFSPFSEADMTGRYILTCSTLPETGSIETEDEVLVPIQILS